MYNDDIQNCTKNVFMVSFQVYFLFFLLYMCWLTVRINIYFFVLLFTITYYIKYFFRYNRDATCLATCSADRTAMSMRLPCSKYTEEKHRSVHLGHDGAVHSIDWRRQLWHDLLRDEEGEIGRQGRVGRKFRRGPRYFADDGLGREKAWTIH